MRIGNNHAGVDCKGLASHDPFLHAARHHRLEQLAQQIALAKTTVAVLGKRRMIWNIAIEPKHDCDACALKPKCCPNAPARKIARSIHEAARDKARAIAKTEAYAVSRRERKKVEMLFAHLKRILRLDRLRLRGPSGAKDEFLLAATAQNLRKLARIIPLPTPVFAT